MNELNSELVYDEIFKLCQSCKFLSKLNFKETDPYNSNVGCKMTTEDTEH